MIAYLWQFGETVDDVCDMRLQVTKIPGKSVRKIVRELSEQNWKEFGESFDKNKLHERMFQKTFKNSNQAKKECSRFEYDCYYVNRNNKETKLNNRERKKRTTKANKKKRQNKQRPLTLEERGDLKKFFIDNQGEYNIVSLQDAGETERTFYKRVNRLVKERYDVICKPDNVYSLLSQLGLVNIIPAKGRRGRKKK